jgi:hypothetical protein
MSATPYRSLDEKPYESDYLYVETTLDHPVAKVWPHALNIGAWMSAHRLETVGGEPGKVGHFERVYPKGIAPETGQPHYHVYGIAHVIPQKLVALEVLPERGGSYGNARQWMSFDSVLLTDMGSKTHVVFLMIDAQMGRGDEAYRRQRAAELEGGRDLLESYFENLKQLVEHGG